MSGIPTIEEILADELLFMRYNLNIRDKRGQIIPFNPNRVQLDFGASLTGRDLVLKARQMGLSTYIQAKQYTKTTTNLGRTSATIAHDMKAASNLRRMTRTFYKYSHPKLRPVKGRDDKSETTFPDIEGRTYIGTAGTDDFGRSDTIHFVHCSEFAFWKAPDELLTAVTQAVPDRHIMPDTHIIIESTPNGARGTFYDMCMAALEGFGEYKLHFYAWWWDDTYQIPLLRGEKIVPEPDEKALMDQHGLSLAQIKWRRNKIAQLGEQFRQEYPEDPITCFLRSGRARFDQEALMERVNNGQVMAPIEEGMIEWVSGQRRPALRIYAHPIEGEAYVIGADTSTGDGGDSSAGIIRRWSTNEQVAVIHGQFEPVDFAKHLAWLGRRYNGAIIGVERNMDGNAVLTSLLRGTEETPSYSNIFFAEDGKMGWHTNAKTRPVMIADLAEEYRDVHAYTIRDRMVINQALNFIYTHTLRAQAAKHYHDDLVIADAIAGQMRAIPQGRSWAFGPPDEPAPDNTAEIPDDTWHLPRYNNPFG